MKTLLFVFIVILSATLTGCAVVETTSEYGINGLSK